MRKNRKLCKVQPKRHLPSDLYPDILSHLPVKSLLRFRCVSKSWLALVDNDADFARLHLNTFKNNTDGTHLFIIPNNRQNCVVRRRDTFETVHSLGSADYIRRSGRTILCSVDGLILFGSDCFFGSSSQIVVWNPSTRKNLPLPFLPENFHHSFVFRVFGLGYDASAKEYRIVLFVFESFSYLETPDARSSRTPVSVLIYTLGDNSWKTIKYQVKGGSPHFGWERFDWGGCAWSRLCPRLYFQGCLYMVFENKLGIFDLSSEVFSTICAPENHYRTRLAVVDGGESLAMYDFDPRENSIWVLETESMSWTKRYTFKLKCFEILYLYNNCDILVLRRRSEKIDVENEEKKKERRWDQAVVYSPETGEYKNLHDTIPSPSYHQVRSVCGYVESLILHSCITESEMPNW